MLIFIHEIRPTKYKTNLYLQISDDDDDEDDDDDDINLFSVNGPRRELPAQDLICVFVVRVKCKSGLGLVIQVLVH